MKIFENPSVLYFAKILIHFGSKNHDRNFGNLKIGDDEVGSLMIFIEFDWCRRGVTDGKIWSVP